MHALPAGRLLLGFSGGPDSTGLAVRLAGRDPLLAYVDHRMRGPRASRRERERARAIARSLGLELVRTRVSVAGPGEAAARRARFEALGALLERHGCCAIATAHSADDRAETILLNLLRGTGLRGLAAPLPLARIGGVLRVRPCLDERRLLLHAEAAPYGPLLDRTNRSTGGTRSRLRHLALPSLARALGEDPVPLLCGLADLAARLRAELEVRAGALGPDALLAEPDATFPYLVEALRTGALDGGPPLTAKAYRSLRDFLSARHKGRVHTTPGGESWSIGRDGRIRVSPSSPAPLPSRRRRTPPPSRGPNPPSSVRRTGR